MIDKTKQYRKLSESHYKGLGDKDGLVILTNSMPLFRRPEYGDSWGDWVYMENDTLRLYRKFYPTDEEERMVYEIDIERFDVKPEAMNWLIHLSEKSWCNREILGDLVYAFTDIKGWIY
jgi:hypothetical protein